MNKQRGRRPTADIIVTALILGCSNVTQYISAPELRDSLQILADAYNHLRPLMRSDPGDAAAGRLISTTMLQVLRDAKEVIS